MRAFKDLDITSAASIKRVGERGLPYFNTLEDLKKLLG